MTLVASIGLHGEALVSALIQVPAAGGMAMLVPAADVGDSEPLHEPTEVAVAARAQDQVPVVGHEAVAEQIDGHDREGFAKAFLEGGVVAGVVEELAAGVGAVEDVEDHAARGDAGGAGHEETVAKRERRVNLNVLIPFSGLNVLIPFSGSGLNVLIPFSGSYPLFWFQQALNDAQRRRQRSHRWSFGGLPPAVPRRPGDRAGPGLLLAVFLRDPRHLLSGL